MSFKGQVTVPKVVRDALGINEGDHIVFRVEGDRAVLAWVDSFFERHARRTDDRYIFNVGVPNDFA